MALDGKSISPMDYVTLGIMSLETALVPYRLTLEKKVGGGYFYNITHALLLFTHHVGD